jgi:hypothetical protein
MRQVKIVAAVLLLAGGGAAGGYLAGRRGATPAPVVESARPAQQAELARLAAQAMAVSRPAPPSEAPPEAAPVEPEPVAPVVPRPTPQEEAAWLAARAKNYDDALAREPRNEAWAAPLERKLRDAYPPTAGHTRLIGVECRTHVCRVEVETADGADRNDELRAVTAHAPELANASYAYPGEPESHRQAVVYLMRDGHLLPRLDYATYYAASAGQAAR